MLYDEDFFTNFICGTLPSPSKACAHYRKIAYKGIFKNNRNMEDITSMTVGDLFVDIARFAVALFDIGYVKDPSKLSLKNAIEKIYDYQETKENITIRIDDIFEDAPKVCLSELDARSLIDATFAIESYMCNEWFQSENGKASKERLVKDFNNPMSKQRQKYCIVDIDTFLQRNKTKWLALLE